MGDAAWCAVAHSRTSSGVKSQGGEGCAVAHMFWGGKKQAYELRVGEEG